MRRPASRTRFHLTRVLLAALGVSSALSVSMLAHALPALAASCTIVMNPTAAHHTDCSGANLYGHNYSGVNLSYANLSDASLMFAIFSGANLSHADVSNAKGFGINLSGAILYYTNLTGGDFSNPQRGILCHTIGLPREGANRDCYLFETAELNGCTIVKNPTEKHHTDCPGAKLSGKVLSGPSVNLSWANLPGAILTEAKLHHTNLSHANLADAYLIGAQLFHADLTDAKLSGGYNLDHVQWGDTTCPDATNSDKDGGTCVGHLGKP